MPPLAGCLPPLEILLYIYCIVQHVALAPPGMRKQLFCLPLSKILNAALASIVLPPSLSCGFNVLSISFLFIFLLMRIHNTICLQ